MARAKEIIAELCQNTLVIPITYDHRRLFVGKESFKEQVRQVTGASLCVVFTEKAWRLLVAGSKVEVDRARGEVASILQEMAG